MPGTPPARRPMPSPDAAVNRCPLAENLAALWAADPATARLVEAVPPDAIVGLEPTRSGHHTAVCRDAAGHAVALHSRYDPVAEAVKQAGRIDAETLEVFLVGLGLGHTARALLDRLKAAVVWAFEARPAVLRAALAANDFADAIQDRRLRFVLTLDKARLFDAWMPHLAAASTGHQRLEHAPSVRLDPQFCAHANALLDEWLAYGRTTINTLVLNSRRTCENLAKNVPWYVTAGGIGRLKNAMAGKPAIVVSAGPSLRKNKHLLKDAAGHAVIVAVQTTFQQLVDLGVEPDFVTSLDYHDICEQFFRNVPRHVRTELVAEPKATPKVFDLHPGPLSLLGNDFIDRLLAEMPLDRARLESGATVAHLAFYLAQHLGCDPIIFVGQDLGFSDGLAYAPGTSYDELWRPELGRYNTVEMMQWQRIVRDRHILRRVPDYQGKSTYTEERLYSYLQQFERDFADAGQTIIDATEGGVSKRGATAMPLADALAEHCRTPIDKCRPPHPGRDTSKLTDAEACLVRRRDEAAAIERASLDTLPLLTRMADRLDDAAEMSRLSVEVDRLREDVARFASTYDLVTQLGQKTELERFAADRRIEAAGVEGVERQRRQLRRDHENVAQIARSAADFQALMTECVAGVRTMIDARRAA